MMLGRWRWFAGALAWLPLLLAACHRSGEKPKPAAGPAASRRYAPADSCAACHAGIAATFARTGMGRAFTAFDPARTTADFRRNNRFYHAASERFYTMRLSSDGKSAFMRRHQRAFDGREENVVELAIDYILGSGHNAQSFLHRTARNELVQLPVAWYTGNGGGYWAMNPGYDRRDHADFRRRIGYDCFFCHNAYPEVVSDSPWAEPVTYPKQLPGGIDCQRCHGPGGDHAESGGKAPIVNPKNLARDLALDVCLQCHLQSTSTPLPHAIVKLGRGVFSFRPGEPLGDYAQHFDHAAGAGREEKFEIAHAAYRLRQSACFTRSDRLTCTTCHNPHDVKRGVEAVVEVSRACRECHAQPSAAAHKSPPGECVSCHMPKRRTDDAVHVVMTDHRIVKHLPPAGKLTAPRPESAPPPYQGRVEAYYPKNAGALHLALGQVRVSSNLAEGIGMLEAAIAADPNRCDRDCYFELAEAYGRAGRAPDALKTGERALALDPANPRALAAVGAQRAAMGDLTAGAELLERAGKTNPRALHDLAVTYLKQGRADAAPIVRGFTLAAPDIPELHATLASILYSTNDLAGAERAFREAVRLRPDYALARANLAVVLINRGAFAEAEFQFQAALRAEPGNQTVRQLYQRARGQRQ